MPVIDTKELGTPILKPSKLNAEVGSKYTFVVAGPHQTREVDGRLIYSVPVRTTLPAYPEGIFPLNKTSLRTLVQNLGDNSDDWIGATIETLVIQSRNPRTDSPTLSFQITKVAKQQTKLKK